MAPRYPESTEAPDTDASAVEGVLDGVAGAVGVPVSEGGAWVLVAVGSEDTVAELPVVAGAVVGADGSPVVPVGLTVEVPLGDASGVRVGVGLGDAGIVAGRGRGACGLFSPGSCGSMKKPMPSPATARTDPAAFCTARARRRARTPDRRRAWCPASKGVCSWESRIIRASSCSK
ncbi:hypothetical protein [Streptomyces sp. NBC_00005]|uniref:hypothetical protein n=1 Tax=Streptomyces sp. NBC_00005 TaxID=2903609 RepID=UPI003249DA6F